ncbi:hypothetical protein E4T81_12115 [Barnesiella sp. WM24]|uniref:dUTP diphosphatase n=1 Tax=Barnesiella sp. WM24 TaxID=2558278 RepID=UPI00107262D3|nr:hypothetical protein [Barnesiella sp. WM24]TFU92328.1 hypothetical protein E4T81_12115 [Barnesiella sp. WM24]
MKRDSIVLEVAHFGAHYILPQKAKPGSIGFDLTVPEDTVVPARSRCKIPLNIAINLPKNIEGKIEPRSGFELYGMEGHGTRKEPNLLFGIIPNIFFPWKHTTGIYRWDCDVLVGKIDPGYTDNINVIVKNNDEEFTIKRGTRIAQMTFYKVLSPEFEIVDKLSCESRGGGLGSSGSGLPTEKKDIPFHEYYASLPPEKRKEVDATLMGKIFNS